MTQPYRTLQQVYINACKSTVDRCKHSISIINSDELVILGERWKLSDFEEIAVVGWGKAASPIIDYLMELIILFSVKSMAITPDRPRHSQSWFEGHHPRLRMEGVEAAKRLVTFVKELSARSLLIAVSSGGGSANLWSPARGVSAEEKLSLINRLICHELDCRSLNNIRKCLSSVKAGRLLDHVASHHIINLVISDDVRTSATKEGAPTYVASGPLVPQLVDYPTAKADLLRLGIYPTLSKDMCRIFEREPDQCDTSKAVKSFVLADNSTFINHLETGLQSLGYKTARIPSPLTGKVEEVAMVLESYFRPLLSQAPVALVAGGEPVCPADRGVEGGRCRHLVCCLGERLADVSTAYIASFSSDGTDYSNVGGGGLIPRNGYAFRNAISKAIREYNSGRFIEAYGDIFELPSGIRTNVGDAVILLNRVIDAT